MKTTLTLIFVLFLNVVNAQTDYKQNLINQASIVFPSAPEYHNKNTDHRIKDHYYKYENNTNVWKVQVRDFSESKLLKLRPQDLPEFYLSWILSATRHQKAALANNKEIEINGLKAVEFEYYYTDDKNRMIQTLQRIFYFNNLVVVMDYSTYISSYSGNSIRTDAKSDKFFNSFMLSTDRSAIKQYNLEASAAKSKPKSGILLGLVFVLGIPFALGALIF